MSDDCKACANVRVITGRHDAKCGTCRYADELAGKAKPKRPKRWRDRR